METYYITVKGPRLSSARTDLPYAFYIVHAENLHHAWDKVKNRHPGGRLFVHDANIKKEYKTAGWKELG